MNMRHLVKKSVYPLRAYDAKDIPCKIKLDANESPFGFAEALSGAGRIATNRYPDPGGLAVKRLVAKDLGVAPENILLGNGSDELIYYLVTTFGGPVLYPVPTFSMYGIISRALGEEVLEVPLDEKFDLDMKAMSAVMKRQKPKIIFLSSPNNPTGNCFSSESILKLVEASRGIVVVDEAYQPYSSEKGFVPLLRDFDNLVIMRTLSKIGLAALRLGFVIAAEAITEQVNKVRLPFNVNSLSQAVAAAALRRRRQLDRAVSVIRKERDRLLQEMSNVEGMRVFPSEANFILFRITDADGCFDELLKRGILVRNLSNSLKDCLRVTVGTPDENAAFLRALKDIVRRRGR